MGDGKSTTTTKKPAGRRRRDVGDTHSTTGATATATKTTTTKTGNSKTTNTGKTGASKGTTTSGNFTGSTTASGNNTNCPVGFLCIDVKGEGQCQACPKQCPKTCFIKNNKPTCPVTTTTKKPAKPAHGNGPVVKCSIAFLALLLMVLF